MGVPKFYRFMSDRYPCLSEIVREYQIPEYDNLYLDMNGIIHTCSHPNDLDPLYRISEEQIYRDIFHYIEILFHMIKPQKIFFMAVDGVAPRAKINQQRSRRFRSAKNATELERTARDKGQVIPEEARFDSNCITPGTVFMTRLNEQLKYFIACKITNDKLWQKCEVILSGHETPGEGEHKIMDYIRYIKSQPNYDSNTRHCLYGLDADLIMLGLCTHEPHFSLLREETQFGRKQKRVSTPEKMKFYLLHLSMMREYIEHEFSSLKDKLCFEYDMEKIIDDWVLMGFLIGNDFIPNLPHLEINDGAFPTLYSVYMEVLPTLDGYLNEGGTLILKRFEKFMNGLSRVEINHFRNHYASSKSLGFNVEFAEHKRDYYMKKLGYKNVDADVLRSQAECYVRAIQWNLNYYYNGCCSWSWYYPHHYAPYISDIKGFKNMKLEFEMGRPFLPFQQLLAVLPAASRSLLPQPFESLMIDELSPIKDYYPADFHTDKNGKRQEWEAVVLMPFIQETILLQAMEPCYAKLTLEENQRNSHGPMNVYSYTEEDLGPYEAPEYFPNLPANHAKSEPINPEDIVVPIEKLVKGLCPGMNLDVYFLGFPTMKHIDHTSELREAIQSKGSKHMSGSGNRIQINILPSKTCPNLAELASQIIGKEILVSWPHLVEAHVVAVSNRETIFKFVDDSDKSVIKKKMNEPLANQWNESKKTIDRDYDQRLCINVGETEILVHAHLLTGRCYIFDAQGKVSLEKQWTDVPSQFALQTTVRDIAVHESSFVEYKRIGQIFTPKSICFMLVHPHYGAVAEVIKVHTHFKVCQVKLAVCITKEPILDSLKERTKSKPKMQYMHGRQAVKKLLGITSHLFSRITGSLFVVRGPKDQSVNTMKHNLGLDLKFNTKNQEVPNYTKKVEAEWLYSMKTVDLVRAYMLKYPALFEHLAKNVKINNFHEDDLFPATGSTTLNDVLAWLNEQPFKKVQRSSCDAEALDQEEVQELEQVVDAFMKEQNNDDNVKTVMMKVKPHSLYKSSLQIGNFPPDVTARYKIYDRIVNVRESFTVPIGYKGTIVGIERSRNIADYMFEVVFDKTFAGGFSVKMCSANRGYRLGPADFINLSHGVRTGSFESGEPKADAEP